MAVKHSNSIDNKSASSDDDEITSSEEEEVESSEANETESDSESDSDSDTPTFKPLSSSTKRPSESKQEAIDAKRPKTAVAAVDAEEMKKTGNDSKMQLFQRVFSEDDEIAILKGILAYFEKKGSDPLADMNAFYDFVKKSIHTVVTKAQLKDKIRRLEKKFKNNVGKGKMGKERVFSKFDQEAFNLSKLIWGENGIFEKVESSAARSNEKARVLALTASKVELQSKFEEAMEAVNKKSNGFFDKRFGVGSLEGFVLKHDVNMMEGEKKVALGMKWIKFQISELELFKQRNELVNELFLS